MNIPQEAVEAAERGLKECLESQGIKLFTEWKDEARAALVAAMPYIRKQIAEEVREELHALNIGFNTEFFNADGTPRPTHEVRERLFDDGGPLNPGQSFDDPTDPAPSQVFSPGLEDWLAAIEQPVTVLLDREISGTLEEIREQLADYMDD